MVLLFFGVHIIVEMKLSGIVPVVEVEGVQPLRINFFSPSEIRQKVEYNFPLLSSSKLFLSYTSSSSSTK